MRSRFRGALTLSGRGAGALVLPNVQAACLRPEFGQAARAVLHTGPSATADIEGAPIHGAPGVRSLTVVLQPRAKA